MTHIPNKIDIKTDLRRAVMASFSDQEFNDANTTMFLQKAEENLKKVDINKNIANEVYKRINLAKDSSRDLEKRREDLLTASILI